jgi:hypothetical protein
MNTITTSASLTPAEIVHVALGGRMKRKPGRRLGRLQRQLLKTEKMDA